MKSYKEMKELIEAQNEAIEYLFKTVDDQNVRIQKLEIEMRWFGDQLLRRLHEKR